MAGFDVAADPWIHARSGTTAVGTGIAELLLRAHELTDWTLPVPPAMAGLWRVLYVIAGRVTGLDDPGAGEASWRQARNRVLAAGRLDPSATQDYLQAHAGSFCLLGTKRPWLQDPRLAVQCVKDSGAGKFVLTRASGNNLVWSSHDTDARQRPVTAAEAARHLLAWLWWGPSGISLARTVDGRTESNMTAGPLRSRVSWHPIGASVFESLILGIPWPGHAPGSRDIAPWEDDQEHDPLGPPPARGGLSGLLTSRFRHAILLNGSPDGTKVISARITWAWRQPHPAGTDPYLIYNMRATGGGQPYARYASARQAAWRDLPALLAGSAGDRRAAAAPLVLAGLPAVAVTGPLRLRRIGWDQDGQVADRQWFTDVTGPVVTALLDADDGPARLDDAGRAAAAGAAATAASSALWSALSIAWTRGAADAGPPGAGPWAAPGEAYLQAGGQEAFDAALAGDQEAFARLAVTVYDRLTRAFEGQGVRAAVGVAAGLRALAGLFPSGSFPSPPVAAANGVPGQADAIAAAIAQAVATGPGLRARLARAACDPVASAGSTAADLAACLPGGIPDGWEMAAVTVAVLIAARPEQPRPWSPPMATGDLPAVRGGLGAMLAKAARLGAEDAVIEAWLRQAQGQDCPGACRLAARIIRLLPDQRLQPDWGCLARDLSEWPASPGKISGSWARDYARARWRLKAAEPRENAAPSAHSEERT